MDQDLAAMIGRNIHKHRIKAGLTQGQLAEAIGVSTAFISRVECGQKLMKLERLYAASKALNISCGSLFHQEGSDDLLNNICELLSGKSPEFISGIEQIIRICEQFEEKDT